MHSTAKNPWKSSSSPKKVRRIMVKIDFVTKFFFQQSIIDSMRVYASVLMRENVYILL